MKFSRLAWRSALIFFLLVSCQSKPVTPEAVAGKWQDRETTMEFHADGLFILTGGDKGESYSGSWQLLDDGRIQVEFTAQGAPRTTFFHVVAVSKDQLDIKGPNGEKGSLKRIK